MPSELKELGCSMMVPFLILDLHLETGVDGCVFFAVSVLLRKLCRVINHYFTPLVIYDSNYHIRLDFSLWINAPRYNINSSFSIFS